MPTLPSPGLPGEGRNSFLPLASAAHAKGKPFASAVNHTQSRNEQHAQKGRNFRQPLDRGSRSAPTASATKKISQERKSSPQDLTYGSVLSESALLVLKASCRLATTAERVLLCDAGRLVGAEYSNRPETLNSQNVFSAKAGKAKEQTPVYIADVSHFGKNTSGKSDGQQLRMEAKNLIFPKLLLTLFLTIFTIPLSQRERIMFNKC